MAISNSEIVREVLSIVQGASSPVANPAECEDLWRELVQGRAAVIDWSSDVQRGHLVLALAENGRAARALPQRSLLILEGLLLGVSRKVMSADQGLATSSIAQILRGALLEIGVDCAPARVPPLLVMLLHVARGRSLLPLSVQRVEHAGAAFIVVTGMIDARTYGLTPAQLEVLGLRLAGKSHADIASSRRTSRRTVANQIAAATHRLGVSGRFELLSFMALAH